MSDRFDWDTYVDDGRPIADATVCTRPSLGYRIEKLREQHAAAVRADAVSNEPDTAPGIAELIAEAEQQARESERTFVFRAVGRKAWRDLLAAHPPREQDAAGWDSETFPPAAMHASCIHPEGLPLEEFQRHYDEWPIAHVQALWSACLAANVGEVETPKGLGV